MRLSSMSFYTNISSVTEIFLEVLKIFLKGFVADSESYRCTMLIVVSNNFESAKTIFLT